MDEKPIERGGGDMTFETARLAFSAPSAILVPTGCAHGFRFRPTITEGWVVSFTEDVAAALGDRSGLALKRLKELATEPVIPLGGQSETRRLAALFDGSLPFVGFIDDAPPAWEYMFGLPIVAFNGALDSLRPDAIILSSDAWEARMWERTEPFRRAGVRVIPVYADYRVPKGTTRRVVPEGQRVGWADILEHWDVVVPDLAAVYGVDLYDPAYRGRSWPWLKGLIIGLLGRDSALRREFSQNR